MRPGPRYPCIGHHSRAKYRIDVEFAVEVVNIAVRNILSEQACGVNERTTTINRGLPDSASHSKYKRAARKASFQDSATRNAVLVEIQLVVKEQTRECNGMRAATRDQAVRAPCHGEGDSGVYAGEHYYQPVGTHRRCITISFLLVQKSFYMQQQGAAREARGLRKGQPSVSTSKT